MKTKTDIHFIKTYKQENIMPTFAKVKPSIKHGNKKIPFENSYGELLWKQNCTLNITLKKEDQKRNKTIDIYTKKYS